MRIFLQAQPTPSQLAEAPKYLQLMLQQDMFGAWTLIRESGQVGLKPSVKRDQFLDFESAQAALMHARDQQLKKGFVITFAEGQERPSYAQPHGILRPSTEL
jgi:predicted DNA-binding WGR domain protein